MLILECCICIRILTYFKCGALQLYRFLSFKSLYLAFSTVILVWSYPCYQLYCLSPLGHFFLLLSLFTFSMFFLFVFTVCLVLSARNMYVPRVLHVYTLLSLSIQGGKIQWMPKPDARFGLLLWPISCYPFLFISLYDILSWNKYWVVLFFLPFALKFLTH